MNKVKNEQDTLQNGRRVPCLIQDIKQLEYCIFFIHLNCLSRIYILYKINFKNQTFSLVLCTFSKAEKIKSIFSCGAGLVTYVIMIKNKLANIKAGVP